MSYANPQSWDDIDFGGNPLDWSSRTDKLLYPAYEMMRKSLIEHLDFRSFSVPAILQTDLPHDNELNITLAWKESFQDEITDQLDNFWKIDKDFTGDTSFGSYDEATMLADIGDSERYPATEIHLAEWEIQQYEMLNRLKCVRMEAYNNDGSYRIGRHQAAGDGVAWSTLYAQAKAQAEADWLAYADGTIPQYNAWVQSYLICASQVWLREQGVGNNRFVQIDLYNKERIIEPFSTYPGYNYDVDYYSLTKVQHVIAGGESSMNDVYSSPEGYLEDKWNLLETRLNVNDADNKSLNKHCDEQQIIATMPTPPIGSGNSVKSSYNYEGNRSSGGSGIDAIAKIIFNFHD